MMRQRDRQTMINERKPVRRSNVYNWILEDNSIEAVFDRSVASNFQTKAIKSQIYETAL